MATDSNKQQHIERAEGVSTADAKVEIFLDNRALKSIISDYKALKNTLDNWYGCMKESEKGLSQSTGGEASSAFDTMYNEFDVEWFRTMHNNLTIALPVLDEASTAATNLLWRCEDFYSILLGAEVSDRDVGHTAGATAGFCEAIYAPIESKLYLDNRSETIKTSTDVAIQDLLNISSENDEVDRILGSLEMGEIDYHSEIIAINIDCHKRQRLTKLWNSFELYVAGVGKLNDDTVEGLSPTIYREMACDNTRTYEYPYINGEKEMAFLDIVMRNELHEMGLTDEAIDKLLEDGNFTLQSLVVKMEEVVAEDMENSHFGKEVDLVTGVLNGNPDYSNVEFFNGSEKKCWDCIALYHTGMVHTVCENRHSRIDDGSDKLFQNEMNAILISPYAATVTGKLRDSAYEIVMKSYADYVYAYYHFSPEATNIARELFRKDLLIYDSYAFFGEKIKDDLALCEPLAVFNQYKIDDISYGDEGFVFEVRRHMCPLPGSETIRDILGRIDGEYEPIEYESIDENEDSIPKKILKNNPAGLIWSTAFSHSDDKFFTMTVSEVMGFSNIAMAKDVAEDGAALVAAQKEQTDLIFDLAKDGGSIVADYAVPGSVEVIEYLYNFSNGINSPDEDVLKEYAESSAQTAIDHYCEKTGMEKVSGFYSNATTIISDTQSLMNYDGVNEAKEAAELKDRARLVGSEGKCKIEYANKKGETEEVVHVLAHEGITDPAYGNTINEISQESTDGNKHGLSKLCNWDEETVNKIHEKQIEEEKPKKDRMEQEKAKADALKKELDSLSTDDKEYNKVKGKYEKQQKTYNSASMDYNAIRKDHIEENKLIDGGYTIDNNTNYTELRKHLDNINEDYHTYYDKLDPDEQNKESKDVYGGWSTGVASIR